MQCSAVQYSAVHCSAVQCSAVHCSTEQSSAVQCSTVKCNTVQCNTVQRRGFRGGEGVEMEGKPLQGVQGYEVAKWEVKELRSLGRRKVRNVFALP